MSKVDLSVAYEHIKPLLSFAEFCISSVIGVKLFIWLGAFINYEVVKFLIVVLTGMAVGASNEFGKKALFPFLSRTWKTTLLPYIKEKYLRWKKSKNS